MIKKGSVRKLEKKGVSGITLIVLLIGMLTLAFNIQLIEAESGLGVTDSWVWVRDTVTGAYGEAIVGTGTALYIASGTSFYRYQPADESWVELASPPEPDGAAFKTGTALAWDSSDYVYALYGAATGDSRRRFYRYSIPDDSWEALANTTADQGEGDAIAWVSLDNSVYATIGGEQRPTYPVRYDPSTNSWNDTSVADPPAGMGDGASLVWTGGNFLYALRGEFSETSPLYDFWRYDLATDTWTTMAEIPAGPHSGGMGGVGDGGSLLYIGLWLSNQTDFIYALSGNQAQPDSIPDNRTYRYTISADSWERLADLPFGVGHYVGNRLGYADGHIYAWQGAPSTWTGGGDDLARYEFALAPRTWTVDDDGPADFHTIQGAINAANPGDTIYVHNGTYYENVFINKTVSLVGENPQITIVDGSKANATFSPVVHVFGEGAKDVRICNFTIKGSNEAWGIYLTFHANALIERNIVANNSGGIVADFSNENTFVNNTVTNNRFEGILFFYSSENTMRNNTISGNAYNFGILGSSFTHDIDTSNLANGKPIYYLKNQSNLSINPDNFSNIGYLALINCTGITVESLNLKNNYNGLLLVGTKNSILRNNFFENNLRGIDIIDSLNNTIEDNNVKNNTWLGISLIDSPNNRFRENTLTSNQLNFKAIGECFSDFIQEIDLSNTVDGKVMRYLINFTDLVVNPLTFNNTGYLALVNCYNITAKNLSLENNEMLVAFTQNSSIVKSTIERGGISLRYSSFINLTRNVIMNGELGVSIHHSDNNIVAENSIVENREYGIRLQASSCNAIFGNDMKSNGVGIRLGESSNNTIFGNNITDNKQYGLNLWKSSYNKILHNNFINNSMWQAICSFDGANSWDNDYPSGGNYWSDYNGTDSHCGQHQDELGSDGIGDTAYTGLGMIIDYYPLMQPMKTFGVGVWEGKTCNVHVISNSTVSNFQLNATQKIISFNVTGETGLGFCRVTIPNIIIQEMWRQGSYSVLVNGQPVEFRNWTDNVDTYIYFTYEHSTHEVTIIPEFPSATIPPLFMALTLLVFIFAKRKILKRLGT